MGNDGILLIGSDNEEVSNTASTDGASSATSASSASLSHDLSNHSGFKYKHHFHHPLESRYSGTDSESSGGDTQGSRSRGTSGLASTVSTQSITLEEFKDLYANNTDGRMYSFNDATMNSMSNGIQSASGLGGGITWEGDDDNEFLFGTYWNDILRGENGDDALYGFEGDDKLYGGLGDDRLFGDAGNDIIYAYSSNRDDGSKTWHNFLSGGSGNDRLFGDESEDTMFGGSGHDYLSGSAEEGSNSSDVMYGEGGNDVLVAAKGS